jgi:hypothetical protein
MAENLDEMANLLGAKVVGEVPDVGGGALGAARLVKIYQARMERIRGSQPVHPAGTSGAPVQLPVSAYAVESLGTLAQMLELVNEDASHVSAAAVLLERIGSLTIEEMEHYRLQSGDAVSLNQIAGEVIRNVLKRLVKSNGTERPTVG